MILMIAEVKICIFFLVIGICMCLIAFLIDTFR